MSTRRWSLLMVSAVAVFAVPPAWADGPAREAGDVHFVTLQGAASKKIKTLPCYPKSDERKCVRSITGPFVITDVVFRSEWLILAVAPDAERIKEEGYIPRWVIDRNAASFPQTYNVYSKLFVGDIHGHYVIAAGETLFLAAPDPGDLFDVTISGYRPAAD